MPATVRSSSTYASAATEASFSVPLPAGFAAGDVCYIFAEGRAATGAFGTAPAGWTAVAASFASGASTSSFMVCYRRVMQAGDANPTVTGTSGRYSAVCVAVQGADNGTPEDVAAVTDNGGASALTTITSPGLTPAASNDLLLTGFGCGTPATGTAINYSTPAGTSLVASVATTVAAVTESGMMVASRALSSNAATGTEQTTITPSAIDGQTVTVAVRAAAAAAGAPARPGRTWLRRFHHRQIPQPPSLGSPFTVVQAAPTVESPSLTTATVTLGQPAGAGNTLVACITTSGGTVNPAVSGITLGGAADHWQAAVTDAGNVAFGGAVWFDPNCAGGQTSVVVTCAGGSGVNPEIYVAVYEVSGVLFFDKGSTGDAASGAAAWSSGATGTTAQAAEIFFGACSANTAVPAVTGAGTWTTQSTGAGNFDQVSGFQIVTALGTATFSGTIPSGAYTAVVATFSAVASGVSGTASLAAASAVTTVVTQAVIASPAGAGAVTAVVTEIPATVALAGAAAVTDVVTQAVTASPAGAGSVTDAVTQIVTANPAGAGAVTAKTVQAVTASPAAAGSVTDAVTQAVTGSIAGAGAVNAFSGGTTAGTATIAGASAVTATAAQGTFAAPAAAGAVTAKAVQAVTAAPAGAGALAALTVQQAAAGAAAAGALTAAGTAASPVTVAASTPTVTAQDTSAATVADPRDGTASVTAAAASVPAVTDPRDGTATVTGGAVTIPAAGLLDESGSPVTGESGGFILLEDGS